MNHATRRASDIFQNPHHESGVPTHSSNPSFGMVLAT
jgi:hypothetical protein